MESAEASVNEQALEEKPKRRLWLGVGCLLILLLLFLFLLILFYPVSQDAKRTGSERVRPALTGSKYTVLSAKRVRQIGDIKSSSKGEFLIATFRVQNLANASRALDYSMVYLGSEKTRIHRISPDVTNALYESLDARSPWLADIGPSESVVARAVFRVPRPGTRDFYLYTKDLDFRTAELKSLPIGKVPLEE